MNRLAKVGPKAEAAAHARMTATETEAGLLSVSSVAEMIGVSKGQLREVVQRPEFLARIRYRKHSADGRPGRSPLIPRELVEDLRAASKPGASIGDGIDEPVAEAQPEAAPREEPQPEPHAQSGPNNQEMSLAIVYERLLTEKDARIADMRAEIEHLRSVLEREQNAHARTQTLLSLQAPAPIQAEPDHASTTEASTPEPTEPPPATPAETFPDVVAAPPETPVSTISEMPKIRPEPAQPAPKRPFWRFWG